MKLQWGIVAGDDREGITAIKVIEKALSAFGNLIWRIHNGKLPGLIPDV